MTGTKICHKCNKVKPLEDFYRQRSRPDGRQTQCKQCQHNNYKKHYATHTVQYAATHRVYYRSNKAATAQKCREYYQAHRAEVADRQKRYNQTHKTQHNVWKRQWRANNKEKVAAYARKARQDPVKHEKVRLLKIIRRVFDHQGLSKSPTTEAICKCTPMGLYAHLCASWEKNYGHAYTGEPCEIDHIAPLKEAKTIEEVHKLYHYSNLQLLTKEDNRVKG